MVTQPTGWTSPQIIAHLDGYMKKFPQTRNPNWYVGIASDVRHRLFIDHKVLEHTGCWAFATAMTHDIAREVERIYLNAGCDGGSGGGDYTTRTVYVYLKTNTTNP
jgi:hypothetical protein